MKSKKKPLVAECENLLEFCSTEIQRNYLKKICEVGSVRKAAIEFGVNSRTIYRVLQAVRKLSSKQGYSPNHDMTRTVPDGYAVKGVSSYYNKDGNLSGQWVKSQIDRDRMNEIMRETIEVLAEEIKGKAEPVKLVKKNYEDVLAAIPIGDAHFGMYAWADETRGDDFNLEIAKQDLQHAVEFLIDQSPDAKEGLLLNLGDFFHTDDKKPMTPASGNLLDVSGRYLNVVNVGVRTLKFAVREMLKKYEKVRMVNLPGNHDPSSAGWLSILFHHYYENEPRVTVDISPGEYAYYCFGKNLIGMTHGHNTKLADLPSIMANDESENWGKTSHRYWWTGHVHHEQVKEYRGCVVETFNTLAAKDAWNASKGYDSRRQITLLLLHKEHGLFNRNVCSVGMLRNQKAG